MNKVAMYKRAAEKVAWPAMNALMNIGKGLVTGAKPIASAMMSNPMGRGALIGGAVGVIKGSTGDKASVGNAVGSGLIGAAGGAVVGKGISALGKGAPALQSTAKLGITQPKALTAGYGAG